ncbi:unnamed protein product [Auanema sp. JU1783]|nr:unnamed protein product [Auanema sp. JU1783]
MVSLFNSTAKRTMSTILGRKSMIAVCQMTSDNNLEDNFKTCRSMILRAKEQNCKMIFFPECFDFIGRTKEEQISLSMSDESPFIQKFRNEAIENNIWLSLGGLHHKEDESMPWNTHLIIDNEGKTRVKYHKLHLFDLEIPGKVKLLESEFSKAGVKMVPPVETPIGNLGLSICYDLRFAELGIWNRKKGAQILSYPSAFTLNTGLAHWEALLRARAIETQCYVVAAAQTGKHNDKRMSYGHAMVVDPWGAVVAQCSERIGMCFAEVDLEYVDELRKMQPVFDHRRKDLYTLHVNEIDEESSTLMFSTFPIAPECIFFRSAHSFAFVNLKPIVEGHILVSPKKAHKNLTDLSDEETADLYITAKKVQKMLQKVYGNDSTTVCVQDGTEAGQTVQHVHVHVVPRRKGDFEPSQNDFYEKLLSHDKEPERAARSLEEMSVEANTFRLKMKEVL